jgi:hypothetical protein
MLSAMTPEALDALVAAVAEELSKRRVLYNISEVRFFVTSNHILLNKHAKLKKHAKKLADLWQLHRQESWTTQDILNREG